MATVTADRTIGEYALGDTLGKGLQGKVKIGTHLKTGEKVALKIMDKAKLVARPKEWEHLQREVKAMQIAAHENVIGLLDVNWGTMYPKKRGGVREVVLLVLELAAGGELFDFLMFTGRFPEHIARTYFQQLLAGLEHCHKNGVFHRDLKPENLLMDISFRLKIADFGLSAITSSDESVLLRTECGTRGYMAPEVVARQAYEGAPVDVWSAGVILFIMLAGFPPFAVASTADWWFQRIRNRQYELFWEAHLRTAAFSKETMSFINLMFVADPAARASVATLRAHPWMAGPACEVDTLKAELLRRKTEVVAQKRAEKEAEMRRRPAGTSSVDPHNKKLARAEGKDSMPPRYTADVMARYTYFYSAETPASMMALLAQQFSLLSGVTKEPESEFVLKTKIRVPDGELEIMARLHSTPSGLLLVEFVRRAGSLIVFQDLFREVTTALADAVAPPPVEVEA